MNLYKFKKYWLKKCRIFRCNDVFHDLFSLALFLHLAQSVIVLSVSVIMIMYTDFSSQPVMYFLKIEYIMTMFSEVALYCHFGTEIYFAVCWKLLSLQMRWIKINVNFSSLWSYRRTLTLVLFWNSMDELKSCFDFLFYRLTLVQLQWDLARFWLLLWITNYFKRYSIQTIFL